MYFSSRFLWILPVGVLISIAGSTVYSYSLKYKQNLAVATTKFPQKKNTSLQVPPVSVKKFGQLVLGDDHPLGYGYVTFYPENNIPQSHFYITVVEKDLWCVFEGCSLEGAHTRMMGGWLQGQDTDNSQIADEIGLEKNSDVSSLVIVANGENRIVGLYPNNGLGDVAAILRLHPDLMNFNLLKGVNELGKLKVGSKSPVMPGDPTGYSPEHVSSYPFPHIPKNKKFYVFSIHKQLFGKGYCAFFECESLNDYPQGSYIEELGGWFSSDGKTETARAFGLNPDRVAQGEQSLVVVTDSGGMIVAIHPGRTFADIIGILSQHKDLVDVKEWYNTAV